MVRAKFSGMLMVCIFLLGVITLLRKAGRGRNAGYLAPRTEPGVRHDRTGLLLRVVTRRHLKGACRTRSSTCDRETPALCPAPGMLDHVPLGPLPSLRCLRWSRGATGVRRLPRYYGAVRLMPQTPPQPICGASSSLPPPSQLPETPALTLRSPGDSALRRSAPGSS